MRSKKVRSMTEYFLDTNIFMYAAGKPHKFKKPCVAILSRVASGNLSVAVDTEVFQEIMYRYHHINLAEKGIDLAWSIVDIGIDVLPVTKKGDRNFTVLLSEVPEMECQSEGYHPRCNNVE